MNSSLLSASCPIIRCSPQAWLSPPLRSDFQSLSNRFPVAHAWRLAVHVTASPAHAVQSALGGRTVQWIGNPASLGSISPGNLFGERELQAALPCDLLVTAESGGRLTRHRGWPIHAPRPRRSRPRPVWGLRAGSSDRRTLE